MFEQKILHSVDNKTLARTLVFVMGLGLMIALAHIKIVLPFTPVPITGQSLGATLIALSWGPVMAPMIMSSYILLGFIGFPVLAGGAAFALLGPTSGYLLGMLVTSYVLPRYLAKQQSVDWKQLIIASFIAKFFIFGLGLLVLSAFVPAQALLASGLYPFIPGDIIKTILAVSAAKALR